MAQGIKMIKYVQGDLFSSPAQVLVNTINTDGVMGKGIALRFKILYPDMFKKYKKLCENQQIDIGKLWIYKTDHQMILNFPTKKHWRNPSKIEYIELGLKKFVSTYQEKGITSVAFPQLGCGNGGLDWNDVKVIMENHLNPLPIDIYVYEQDNNKINVEHENIKSMEKWIKKNVRSMPFQEFFMDVNKILSNINDDIFLFDYEFYLKLIWSKLCNDELIVLTELLKDRNHEIIIKSIEGLTYIEKCKIKKEVDYVDAIYLKNSDLDEVNNL